MLSLSNPERIINLEQETENVVEVWRWITEDYRYVTTVEQRWLKMDLVEGTVAQMLHTQHVRSVGREW